MTDLTTTLPLTSQKARPDDRSLSALLRAMAFDSGRERISVADLTGVAADRAFGALLFVFAFPNILPIPIPGITAIFGLPLMFLTGQLMLGHGKPWLPRFISERSFARGDFAQIVTRMLPWLERAEKVLHPRLSVLTSSTAERIVGAVAFVMAVVIFLPIPLGNMLPGAVISLFALGILARDGLAILLGLIVSLVSVVVVSGVVYGLALGAIYVVRQIFGF